MNPATFIPDTRAWHERQYFICESHQFRNSADGSTQVLGVTKLNARNVYDLAITYLGLKEDKPLWGIKINGHVLHRGSEPLRFHGSKQFVFQSDPLPDWFHITENRADDVIEHHHVDLSIEPPQIRKWTPETSSKMKQYIRAFWAPNEINF